MTQSEFPKYADMMQVLASIAEELHASQIHGLVCGLLCGDPKNTLAWKQMVLAVEEITPAANTLLDTLYLGTAAQLKEFLFDITLLLPSDDQPLPERAEALTLWVQGFLTGLKMTNVPLTEREPSDMTEAINDMIEIAKMNHEQVVASEEDEVAFVELVEYVRVSVILIYQTIREGEEPVRKTTSPRNVH